ncbi:helix-turn-helix domain-containing protein [Streptomyces sp. SP18CM02]|uniref:helix-turn-helix domain-containing protein n=1 Tax=Streptomyces sp. SP18CM02 TaxID=2758571 RepID=UPI001CC2CC8B|nr:helix-turn-helix transcriptional regulator [Streptomyces sp. SP18CM02]
MGRRGKRGGIPKDAAVKEFAELVRALKARDGKSHEALGRRLSISASTLHRYCPGATVPEEFAMADRLTLLCGTDEGSGSPPRARGRRAGLLGRPAYLVDGARRQGRGALMRLLICESCYDRGCPDSDTGLTSAVPMRRMQNMEWRGLAGRGADQRTSCPVSVCVSPTGPLRSTPDPDLRGTSGTSIATASQPPLDLCEGWRESRHPQPSARGTAAACPHKGPPGGQLHHKVGVPAYVVHRGAEVVDGSDACDSCQHLGRLPSAGRRRSPVPSTARLWRSAHARFEATGPGLSSAYRKTHTG